MRIGFCSTLVLGCLLGGRPSQAQQVNSDSETAAREVNAADDELNAARERLEELEARLLRLEDEAASLRATDEQSELEALRRSADEVAAAPETAEERSAAVSGDEVFTSGQRSLQSLNPELSVVVDTGGALEMSDGEPSTLFGAGGQSGFYFRHLGLHLETNLDPFCFTKIAVGVDAHDVHLGEAYMTWVRLVPGVQLTLGKFRQQFGVINRWHVPSLDQFDQPLALTEILGEEGLNQIGLSLDWLLPSGTSRMSNLLVLQVTTPNNGHLFSGNFFDVPTVLLRLQSYYEMSDSTYIQVGATGMWGENHLEASTIAGASEPAFDERGEPIVLYDANGEELGPLMSSGPSESLGEHRGQVWLGGADLTVSWSPLQRERARHVTWRSELYFVSQERREGRAQALGAYSYLDVQLTEAWVLGARGDVTQPFEIDPGDLLRWQAAAYVTWWQSPWVRLRLQYSHADGAGRPMLDRLVLQVVFAAGPHKHERY